MCLVQPLILYYFYLYVYAFIIITSTRIYIKTTACENNHFLLMQAEQNIFTGLILPDIPGLARPTLPTLQECLRMSC